MIWNLLLNLVFAIVLQVIAYALTPKPRTTKPPESRDLENPTAEAGRPIPVVFGTMTVRGINVIHYADKAKRDYEVRV